MELTFSLTTIDTAAKKIIEYTKSLNVYAFQGKMGAGKTTFINALCKAMGIKDSVSSPTFSIINEYQMQTGDSMYHIDLYRLKNMHEALNAGVEECLYSGKICLVEWPERAPEIFDASTLHLTISVISETIRKIEW